jgi:hypothetical protein
VVERVEGNATTDFGAPDAALTSDDKTIDPPELQALTTLLQACWMALDRTVEMAAGQTLRKGPRGGGRELMAIVEHILAADVNYLRRIGWRVASSRDDDIAARLDHMRAQIMDGLSAAARGELPSQGPRGGKRWTPRFFVRRVAWHVIDHAWEIEDRVL